MRFFGSCHSERSEESRSVSLRMTDRESIMTKGIFITATGTDVGKTYVSALIVKTLRKQGINCGYYKPALSGDVYPNDCEYVLKTAGIEKDANDYVSYKFKPALSPHLASQIENNPIKLEKIKTDFELTNIEEKLEEMNTQFTQYSYLFDKNLSATEKLVQYINQEENSTIWTAESLTKFIKELKNI